MPSLFAPLKRLPSPLILALASSLALVACTPMATKPDASPAAARVTDDQREQENNPPNVAPKTVKEGAVTAAALPGVELTGGILYEMLLAEVALRRGQPGIAVAAYANLAQSTKDPRIVGRAAELANVVRQDHLALQLAELWLQIEPESIRARQLLTSALVQTGRLADAEQHIAVLLTKGGAQAGMTLMQLLRAAAMSPNRRELAAMLDRLAGIHPNLPEAHFVRAFSALSTEQRGRALEEVLAARALRPDWEQAALLHAQLLEERTPDQALAVLKEYLEKYPAAKELRLQYARALVRAKQMPEARAQFRILEQNGPANPDVNHALAVLAVQMGDMEDAELRFEALLKAGTGNNDMLRLALGQIADARKKPEQAFQWYDAVKPGPQYLDARLKAATIIFGQKGVDAALTYLRTSAAGSNEDQAQLALVEAQLLRNAQRDKEAFATLERALGRQQEHPDLLYESALLAEKAGRTDLVEPRLRKLIQIKPDFAHGYNALGYSLAERGERLGEAEKLIRKALELAPDDPFILDSLGWVFYRMGKLDQAQLHLQQALDKRFDPEIAAHMGEVLWKQGRVMEAEKIWRDATKTAPGNEALQATMKKFLPVPKP